MCINDDKGRLWWCPNLDAYDPAFLDKVSKDLSKLDWAAMGGRSEISNDTD